MFSPAVMKALLSTFILCCVMPCALFCQKKPVIETTDIDHFWKAYDHLSAATSTADSINIIQQEYFDAATPYFKKFIKARDFTPEEYLGLIRACPRFWKSIRPLTERIAGRKNEIENIFDRLNDSLPAFRRPDICFAIGCLRTGGTTSSDLILVGAEIAAADATVDKTELNDWLRSVLGSTGDIVSMVAHESVHTQQKGFPFFEIFSVLGHKKLTLLNMAIVEGSADFFTKKFLGLNINAGIYDYGEAHQCALWKEFEQDIHESPFDYSKWLYNGNNAKGRPADLAYYIGYKITESFYIQETNKPKAVKVILRRGQYRQVYRGSDFQEKSCEGI